MLLLDVAVLAELKEQIAGIEESPLRPAVEGQPQCADAPVTEYFVYSEKWAAIGRPAKRLLIGQQRDCQNFVLANGQGWRVRQVLEGLAALGSLR